ncbi:MAG: adenylate/guanylate cyclase domain-containing protein [Arenicellales bacterium]|nr:adenylate/guanylate cyclase domain-containing protein [Arenicellales bacterium]
MADKRPSGKLAVILHADIAGSTAMVQQDEHLAHERIQDAFQRFNDIITQYHGYVREIRGDALLAEFKRASDAVTAALAFQADQATHNSQLNDNIRPAVRVGIAMGEVVIADNTVTGAGVVLAQRIEQLAEPGGVNITAAIHEALPQRMPYDQENLGERPLKGFDEPVRFYRVELSTGASVPPPQEDSPHQRAPSNKQNLVIAIGIFALIVVGGVLYWLKPWAPGEEPATVERKILPLPDKPSVAVLPFDNLSDDKSQEYFADGLTDDLITDLSKVSGLFVIARNSVFTFKGKPVRIKTVAEELGVRYVVEGSVRRAGNRIRVNAQLIEGSTDHHIWAERYDGETTDLFALQDQLVGQIVSALAVQLTRTEEKQLTQRPVPEFEAYELYLRARDSAFSQDQARMRESLQLYVKATEVDPTFARAYAGMARLAADMWRVGGLRIAQGGVSKKIAESAAAKALDLDPTLPDAHSVLALLNLTEGNHADALQFAQQAAKLDPNSADAHTVTAIVLGYTGKHELALESMRTAIRLNPRPPTYLTTYYGLILFLNQKYEDAIAVLEPIAGTRDQAFADSPREILAMAYAVSGQVDKAREKVASILKQETFPSLGWYRTAYAYHAREEDLNRRLDALRKAGMPEWPMGFQGNPDLRLTGPILQDLISGKTWSGTDLGRGAVFIQEFGADDSVVYAGPASMLVGRAFIRGDELCEHFEGFTRNSDFCGPVYRDSGSNAEDSYEYVYVNPLTVRRFSLEQ